MSDIDKFISKIEILTSGCWKWTGSCTGAGYGQIWFNGKMMSTHRLSFSLFKGDQEILEDSHICHSCNNRWCVNPEHLILGNAKINHEHARLCGRIPDKDQRYGRSHTAGKVLPKGISAPSDGRGYKCNIRVGPKRYQARKPTLMEAVMWRIEMEKKYWKLEQLIQQDKGEGNETQD